MEKTTYKEIASGKINENKSLIISECSRGGYTLGQKMNVQDNGKTIELFLKGAIHLDNYESIVNIRNAFNDALEYIENNKN